MSKFYGILIICQLASTYVRSDSSKKFCDLVSKRDIARNFVHRRNHAKMSKAPNEEKIPLLIPQNQMVLPHYMGKGSDTDVNRKIYEVEPEGLSRKNSFSSERLPDDIPLLFPHEANGPESSAMENRWNDFHSSRYTPNEKNGHSRSRSNQPMT
ncbi:phospholipase D [Salvia divinorum]|uniref:Phospholipase D n=1 Tax=Salvia divinorum TaxID=28513 RepID=A0ABD1H0P0_SALDI